MKKKGGFVIVLKNILKIFLIIVMLGVSYSLAVAVSENILVDDMISTFIKRADTQPEVISELYDYEWHYYPIKRDHDFEVNDNRNVFFDDAKRDIGNYGDVLLTRQSAFKDIPFIGQFISYYFGGHAAFKNEDGGLYETTGLNADPSTIWNSIFVDPQEHELENVSVQKLIDSYWLDKMAGTQYEPFYRTEMMSVRVKNVTINEINQARDFLDYHYLNNTLYNYLFWLNTEDRFYCSDLISRAYQSVFYPEHEQTDYSKSLNHDGFITSINDIILDDQTFLTSYIKIDTKQRIVRIYYLEDVI